MDKMNAAIRFKAIGIYLTLTFASTALLAFSPGDTVYHYFDGGSVSMYETPWVDGKKSFQIFSRKGEMIYKIENAQQAHTILSTFTFHDNGAVMSVHTRTNPGASMYTYESVIQFDRGNQPLNMQNTQWPAETTEEAMGETWLWQAAKKMWIRQEVVRCAPVPSK